MDPCGRCQPAHHAMRETLRRVRVCDVLGVSGGAVDPETLPGDLTSQMPRRSLDFLPLVNEGDSHGRP